MGHRLKKRLFVKMKSLSVLFLSFFILMTVFMATSIAAVNIWTPQNTGTYKPSDVMSFAADFPSATNVYAGTGSYLGTGGFIYKSIDGGIKWDEKLNNSPLTSYVFALQVDPIDSKIIYAGTYQGVYKTIDGGLNWNPSNGDPRSMTDDQVFALAIDPFNRNRIYVGTRGGAFPPASPNSGGVFVSEDSGASWTERSNGLNNVKALSLLINPSNPLVIYAGTTGGSEQSTEKSGGVYKTTDGGLNWTESNIGLSSTWINALAIDPLNSSIIYAATSDGVFKSIDSGASWKQYKTGITFQHISSVIVDPSMGANKVIYAGGGFKPYSLAGSLNTSGGVYRSINGGEEWTPINTGFKQASTGDISTRIYSLIFKPGDYNTIYAGTNDGIYGYTINANAPKTPTGSNNVTYFHKLSAFNVAGFESPQTDYISATPKAYVEPPTAPPGTSTTGPTPAPIASPVSTGEIRGRVVDAGWVPISSATVRFDSASMTVNSNGEFRFINVANGTYTVYYDAPGYISQTQVLSVVNGGITNAPTVIMSKTGSGTGQIRGRMINTAGQPIPGSTARINNITMFPYPTGDFAFTLMTDGVYTVYYDAPGYTSQTQILPVVNGGITNAPTVIMSSGLGISGLGGPTGQIRGRIVNTSGRPISGSTARINNITMFPYPTGNFAFTLMTDGIYTVFYDAPGYTSQTQVLPVVNGGITSAPTVIMSSSGKQIAAKAKKKVKVRRAKKKVKVKTKKKK
ncbi:MAG: carboxypeptidase regulatory-like domain-containing protein [Actinobacteria bacterium]|nr:carboxypeptidase regulatory-like domain-containing protein [Actinomycetota bacterium]